MGNDQAPQGRPGQGAGEAVRQDPAPGRGGGARRRGRYEFQRHTGVAVRSTFIRNGGSMAEPGAVSWQFERKGVVIMPKTVAEDDLMVVALEAGVEDISDEGDTWQVTCSPTELGRLLAALEEAGYGYESADLTMLPTTTVPLASEADARRVLRVIDGLE